MKLKVFFMAVGLALALIMCAVPAFAATTAMAKPTPSAVLVNGNGVGFNSYIINDYNYFKLRDLALALTGTQKQFNVGWDEKQNLIVLTSNTPYAKASGEIIDTKPVTANKQATLTNQKIMINGKSLSFEAYNIDGYNYFKLRDIGQAFNFGVEWNAVGNYIIINTSKGYLENTASTLTEAQRRDPVNVAYNYATQTLGLNGAAKIFRNDIKEYARVIFTKNNGAEIIIDLYQPGVKGEGGIWAVDRWYDENNHQYLVRDLRALPPLFTNDDNVPDNVKKAVRDAIVTEWTAVFSKYYQVLGFYATNVSYSVTGDNAELKFMMTLVTRNYYKDPDTVGYIKDEKEKGGVNYQILYAEYNMPKSGSVDMKATISLTSSGDVKPDSLRLFSNVSPNGEDYRPVKAEDFIIKSGTSDEGIMFAAAPLFVSCLLHLPL